MFTAVLLTTAIAAHAIAGGMIPSLRTIAGAAITTAAAGWWLSARRRAALTLALAAVLGQLGLHSIFALSMTGANRARALSLVVCGRVSGSMPGQMTMSTGTNSWHVGLMTAGHCLAAAIALISARHLEDLALGVGSYVLRTWRRSVELVLPPARPVGMCPHSLGWLARVCRPAVLAYPVARRGPPAFLLSH